MFNFLTSSTFKILLTSLVISIINIIIINTPRLTTIDYVDSQVIIEHYKGKIFDYEEHQRANKEYLKRFEERVKKLQEAERDNLFSLHDFMIVLTFSPWAIFPFLFPIINKKLLWVFFFPILFSLFGVFSIIHLIAIGVILTFSYSLKNKFGKSNRKTEP